MKYQILTLIILFLILYYSYKNIYLDDGLEYVLASVDNSYYWVRKMNNKSQSANVLAKIKINMNILINHLHDNIKDHPDYSTYILDLYKRTRIIYIMETPKDENFTSYTINKGEKIVFCIRDKLLHSIHDLNTIMYVVIHEMAHVACPEYGHTKLFRHIFRFLLKISAQIDIYELVDYRVNPVDYCGMTINEYIL